MFASQNLTYYYTFFYLFCLSDAFSLIDTDADGIVNRNQLELYVASMAKVSFYYIFILFLFYLLKCYIFFLFIITITHFSSLSLSLP